MDFRHAAYADHRTITNAITAWWSDSRSAGQACESCACQCTVDGYGLWGSEPPQTITIGLSTGVQTGTAVQSGAAAGDRWLTPGTTPENPPHSVAGARQGSRASPTPGVRGRPR